MRTLVPLLVCALPLAAQSEFVKAIEFETSPALQLSNDKIDLTILPKGGNFVSIVLRDDAAKLSARRQLDNLRTHAFVRDREQAGQLNLHAWFYDVSSPDVFEWSDATETFAPLTSAAG